MVKVKVSLGSEREELSIKKETYQWIAVKIAYITLRHQYFYFVANWNHLHYFPTYNGAVSDQIIPWREILSETIAVEQLIKKTVACF